MQKFRKILALALMLMMMASLLCACGKGQSEIPKGMKLVDSEFVNYKLYIPEKWIPDITAGIVTAKAGDNSNISMQMMTYSGNFKSIDDYFRTDYYPKVQSTFKTTALLEDECSTENQKFGTKEVGCAKYVYTVESDGTPYKIMQYFMYHSGYLYIFTYTAVESVFADHLEDVSNIVKNFVF